MAADAYRPDQWHDFFLMVGGGAAALTGLVFVAMSLNLDVIARDSTHRARALGTLAGFAATFIVCALALMGGQHHEAVGLEWVATATIAASVYVYGYIYSVKTGGSARARSIGRVIVGSALYGIQILGAAMLALGHVTGLYLAATAMVVYFVMLISGAWLLVVSSYFDRETPTP